MSQTILNVKMKYFGYLIVFYGLKIDSAQKIYSEKATRFSYKKPEALFTVAENWNFLIFK